eukprot:TRINITY_DN4938_c0_g1_i1.p1 TRINITY_DN4938_c0_g1~~TRINITY_DN4938_c0_g1_i1.p1  ORF type:complete len:292 (-),score=67.26 TRINITY_DN4938_c0_g1_i1:679-1554(-)
MAVLSQSNFPLKTGDSPHSAASTSTSPGCAKSPSTDEEAAEFKLKQLSSRLSAAGSCVSDSLQLSCTDTEESDDESEDDEYTEESGEEEEEEEEHHVVEDGQEHVLWLQRREEPEETVLLDGFLQMVFSKDLGKLLRIPAKQLPPNLTAQVHYDFDEKDEEVRMLILKTLRFLVTFGCELPELLGVLVYACAYFRKANLQLKTPKETGYVLIMCVYLAHSYVLDEHPGPNAWHKNLFASYCDMQRMDIAVFNLMKVLRWKLHVEDGLVKKILKYLETGLTAAGETPGAKRP